MLPSLKLEIDTPNPNYSFLNEQTEENLIFDIRKLCDLLNMDIDNLTMQRDRVIALDYLIKEYLFSLQTNIVKYRSLILVNTLQYFIFIIDRTILNFTIEVQILVNGNLYYCSIKSK